MNETLVRAGDLQGLVILAVIVFSVISEAISRAAKRRQAQRDTPAQSPQQQPAPQAIPRSAPASTTSTEVEIPQPIREWLESISGVPTQPAPRPAPVQRRDEIRKPRPPAPRAPAPSRAPAPAPAAVTAPPVAIGSPRRPIMKDATVALPRMRLPTMREGFSGGLAASVHASPKIRFMRDRQQFRQLVIGKAILDPPVSLTRPTPEQTHVA